MDGVGRTDLEAFDAFAEQIDHPVAVLNIGGLLPGRQIVSRGHAITFFFGDAGDLQDVSVKAVAE